MDEIEKSYVIGLDLGGTNSVFGIVDARGDIKATTAIKTKGYPNFDDYVSASQKIFRLCRNNPEKLVRSEISGSQRQQSRLRADAFHRLTAAWL